MIRNPALRNVPLGIQQKYNVVTCNYVAREQGVTKVMSVVDAQEKCPQLVLVKGEDLTHYREMSYQVTAGVSLKPGNYETSLLSNWIETNPGPHRRLVVGFHIAAELRTAICSKLGLDVCAWVATNKLLAKLVSGSFKPNQQTTLLPQDVDHIMGHLGGLHRVPGVGHQTSKWLQALGLVTVQDLQLFPLAGLVKEYGVPTGQRLKNLSLGVDDSPVVPTGAPKSLSDEDSFKKISTTREVAEKTQELLTSLVERMQKDGRPPQTFRLTIPRYSAENKWFSRESRQCPVPHHLGHKVVSGSTDANVHLVTLAMKLFNKMVDGSTAFHLTLLNVCFTNLPPARGTSSQGAITSFFTLGSSPQSSPTPSRTHVPHSHSPHLFKSIQTLLVRRLFTSFNTGPRKWRITPSVKTEQDFQMKTLAESTTGSEADQPASAAIKTPVVSPDISDHHGATRSTQAPSEDYWTTAGRAHKLPPNVDTDVFRELPEDIQKELLSPAFTRTHPTSSASATSRPVPTPLPLYYGPDRDPASQSQPPLRSSGDSHPLPIRVGSYLCSSDALSTTTEVSRTPPGRTRRTPRGRPPEGWGTGL
ncbi:DNA polymerase iota [Gadus morhua]|uniref:DNA polymerase iota n=1 Tax=Gadus morhua TaxID=8049 RepID=UPI0011B79957|nr:DNA polymerase iota [Gadus morhua]